MNYSRFLNSISLARKAPVSLLYKTAEILHYPESDNYFPFKNANFKLRDGSSLVLNEESLNHALQYNQPAGNPELREWLKNFQCSIHQRDVFKSNKFDICITSGSMEGLSKTFEMLISPGDDVLIETPTYPGVLSALRPLDCNIISIATDHYGIIPESLYEVLQKYNKPTTDKSKEEDGLDGKLPKFLYTIPNGTNPTGASTTLDRKKIIYQLAHDFDLLILEDDPYYFLQFNENRTPSYLSMDVDGRVMRFDSFSKILSSGLRLGFVTGPSTLLEGITLHHMVSSLHSSHLSQVLALELLKVWGMQGFNNHVSKVVEFYKEQKELMIDCAKKHLEGLAEWKEPNAGMFLWIRLTGIKDTKKLIEEKAVEKKVLLLPGCAFYPDDELASPYLRASFSLSNKEDMDEGFKRLAALIKEETNS